MDLQIEEEILLEYDKSHIANNEEGPEILKALAERVDRYWSEEPLNISSVKTILEEHKYPKNVTKFIVPTLNEEIREAVHPALLRMDQKLCDNAKEFDTCYICLGMHGELYLVCR